MDKRDFLVPCSRGFQLVADYLCDLDSALDVSGLQQVMAALQQIVHIGGLILRPYLYPPPPVPIRPPVRFGQALARLAGGPPGQLGSGPPGPEKPRLSAFLADGQEAGGLAGRL